MTGESNSSSWKVDTVVSVAAKSVVYLGFGAVGFLAGAGFRRGKSFASRPPYKPGQKPTLPSASFGKNVIVFDPLKLQSCYNLMISSVTPRPIALVSSRHSKTGIDNVSPFSYFGVVAHDPPILAIGFCRKGGEENAKKDSLENILQSKQFAVNIISKWYLDAANHTSGAWNPEVDEFEQSGLTKGTCVQINAPRVQEAAVTYECELEYVHPVLNPYTASPTTEVVLARVLQIHVDETVLVKDFNSLNPVVDTFKLRPIGRLGDNTFVTLGPAVDIPRPSVS